MSVTLTPKRAKNCANSHAIAPPPRMMSDFGSFFSATASSLVMKPTSFNCGSGDGATLEPVAMTKFLACACESFRRCSIRTRCARRENLALARMNLNFPALSCCTRKSAKSLICAFFRAMTLREIEGDFPGAHAPRFRVFGEMFHFRRVEQRLRRHAAAQDAQSADFLAAFDDDRFQARARRRSRRRIAAAAAADDRHVKIKSFHAREDGSARRKCKFDNLKFCDGCRMIRA